MIPPNPRFGRMFFRRIGSATALVSALLSLSGCVPFSSDQRDHYKFRPEFGVEDPQFRRSLDSVGSVMVDGNSAVLLENGDGMFSAMVKDIREAKVSVNLEAYIFKPDKAGRLFADAMIEAARNGAQVRVLIDGQGGRFGDLKEEMEAAGVICRVYRPLRIHTLYKATHRTHRKLLIVDGKIGYTGGFCIDDRWLGNASDKTQWHDSAVRVAGPVVAQMQAIFSENWTYTTGEILAGDTFYPVAEVTGSMRSQAIKASHGDSSSLPKMLYFMAIQAAHKSIHIQNAYFLPDNQIREALVAAVQRGVDVKVMVPGAQIDIPMVRQASRFHYGPMLEGGVRIYEYQPTMLHSKTLVVDGMFSTIGSINFDARSMSKNAEESLSFYDRSFAKTMEAMFQRDLKRCREITYEAWKHRGSTARFTEWLSWLGEPYY